MVVLILGVNGQDGSFLAEAELLKGNTVVGLARTPTSLYLSSSYNFIYEQCDIIDPIEIRRVLNKYRPGIIYHFAAIHGPYDFDYNYHSQRLLLTNTSSVLHILEWIANSGAEGIKFVYASSSKLYNKFGIINESTEHVSVDLYSLSKIYAGQIINYYREKFNIDASILWLFNHESSRRSQNFFTKKLVSLIASCLRGDRIEKDMKSLNFFEDWGSAMEYMNILSYLVDLDSFRSQDVIFATGVTSNALDLVLNVCKHFKISPDVLFGCDLSDSFLLESAPFTADISKLHRLSGGVVPLIRPFDVILDMVNTAVTGAK